MQYISSICGVHWNGDYVGRWGLVNTSVGLEYRVKDYYLTNMNINIKYYIDLV
jgi:hypothetical protein